MRFYGLETIHSNDKNGSRCENGKSEYVRVFLLTGSCILASCAAIATSQAQAVRRDKERKNVEREKYCIRSHRYLGFMASTYYTTVSFVIIKSNARRSDGAIYITGPERAGGYYGFC